MNRRSFVQISVIGAAVMSIPAVNCQSRNPAMENPLAFPKFLANICDDKTIVNIGVAYQKHSPLYAHKEQLEKLLLTDDKGKTLPSSSDKSEISQMLDDKIHRDFETGKTLFINGWVLSETEARQCVLLALTYQ